MQGEDRHCQIRRRLHLTVGVVKGYCGHGRNFFWNPPSLSRFVQSTHTSPILWVPPKQRRPAHLSHSQAPEVPASAQPVGEVVHWTMRSQPYRPTDRALESPFPRPSSFPVQRGEDDSFGGLADPATRTSMVPTGSARRVHNDPRRLHPFLQSILLRLRLGIRHENLCLT